VKLEHTLTPCTKINSKWLKELNIRQDPIKLREENIGKTFPDFSLMNIFSGQSPKATGIRAKINQWDLIKLTSFGTAKETKKKTKRQLTEWEKLVSSDAIDRGLISRIYKQLTLPPTLFPSPRATTSLLSKSMILFSVERFICAVYQIPDRSDIIWYLSFSF